MIALHIIQYTVLCKTHANVDEKSIYKLTIIKEAKIAGNNRAFLDRPLWFSHNDL